MLTPAVSILLPMRNAAATVDRAIRSMLLQTMEDLEVVAVDDGSSDATGAILESWSARDPRVCVLRQEPLGLVAALNRGLGLCRARLIARMDADDWSHSNRIERQMALLESRPNIGVAGCLVRHGGDATAQAGYARHVAWMNQLTEPEAIARERFVDSPVAHPSVMIRRDCFERHGQYAENGFPEDYDLWLRWMEAGVRFAKVPETLLEWNDPPTRLSRTHRGYAPEAFAACKAHYFRGWLKSRKKLPVWFWGAGKESGRRARSLMAEGILPEAWIDIDPRRVGSTRYGRPIRPPEALPPPGEVLVAALVGGDAARETIRDALSQRGHCEGETFMMLC